MALTRTLAQAVVVITGASNGTGAATALEVARGGGTVVLAARGEPALDAVAERCRAFGGRAAVLPTDVTDPDAVMRLGETAAALFGRIDGWVNNATTGAVGLFEEIPVDQLRQVVEVNLLGVAYGMRAALPHLRAAGGGVLVNNASALSTIALPYQSIYNAAKQGVRGLADTVRQELRVTGERRIAICTVLPAGTTAPVRRYAAGLRIAPPPPVQPPEVAAHTIVRLLTRPRREAYAGGLAGLPWMTWRPVPVVTGFERRAAALRASAMLGLAAGTAAGTIAAVTRRHARGRRW
ncbi:SDR family NAD(P)-dependent oxidoreductase [Asanoa siamensis]|uniref:Short-chain dehydrogenase n=1 Tax=Asanoa siamensis TaxID=926357 RepID=A0ABQ4CPI5_9ACTN|nr:SDR family NAD(P)-dependent oxidoreductase [Asanoa siamensis]GIF72757.1 short-chain dehydrogenase [Asanoa siamensis]